MVFAVLAKGVSIVAQSRMTKSKCKQNDKRGQPPALHLENEESASKESEADMSVLASRSTGTPCHLSGGSFGLRG